MAIQEQYVLSKESNGDVKLTQNSVSVFQSINASAIVNTLVLKEGKVGIGTDAPANKLEIEISDEDNIAGLLIDNLDVTNNPVCAEINNDGTNHGLYIHQDGVLASGKNALLVTSGVAQTGNQLVEFTTTNAATTWSTVSVRQSGSGGCLDLIQLGVLGSGGSTAALQISSAAIQVNNPLLRVLQDNASSTADCENIDNDGTGNAKYIKQDGNLASGKYALYIDNNGTPVDGAGRAIRLDGCTISSTKNPETDAEDGFIAVNIDGVQKAIPYYALS